MQIKVAWQDNVHFLANKRVNEALLLPLLLPHALHCKVVQLAALCE